MSDFESPPPFQPTETDGEPERDVSAAPHEIIDFIQADEVEPPAAPSDSAAEFAAAAEARKQRKQQMADARAAIDASGAPESPVEPKEGYEFVEPDAQPPAFEWPWAPEIDPDDLAESQNPGVDLGNIPPTDQTSGPPPQPTRGKFGRLFNKAMGPFRRTGNTPPPPANGGNNLPPPQPTSGKLGRLFNKAVGPFRRTGNTPPPPANGGNNLPPPQPTRGKIGSLIGNAIGALRRRGTELKVLIQVNDLTPPQQPPPPANGKFGRLFKAMGSLFGKDDAAALKDDAVTLTDPKTGEDVDVLKDDAVTVKDLLTGKDVPALVERTTVVNGIAYVIVRDSENKERSFEATDVSFLRKNEVSYARQALRLPSYMVPGGAGKTMGEKIDTGLVKTWGRIKKLFRPMNLKP